MSPEYKIQSGLEFIAILALAFGFIFEKKIALWERRTFRKIKRIIWAFRKSLAQTPPERAMVVKQAAKL